MSVFSTVREDFGRIWRWTFGSKADSPELKNAVQRLLITIKEVFEKREHAAIKVWGPKQERDAIKIDHANEWLERRGEKSDTALAVEITGRSKDKAIKRIREGLALQDKEHEWPKRPRSN